MKSERSAAHNTKSTRELTEKELAEITKAFGNHVRAQSVDVDRKVQENLQREFVAARSRAALMLKGKKPC